MNIEHSRAEKRDTVKKTAVIYALVAYTAWGFFPLYWKLLQGLSATEILSHRLIWSCFFYWVIFSIFTKSWNNWQQLWQGFRREAKWVVLAAIFISVNWLTYIHAVNTAQVIQGSLAYFITPLMNVFFGALVFREKLGLRARWALASVLCGILVLTLLTHQLPILALIMALTFSSYGLCKKKLKGSAVMTSVLESLVALPVALTAGILIRDQAEVAISTQQVLLLVGGGLVTALPLLWFSIAAQQIPMSTMGFMQFISPTLQFLLAAFLYKEPIGWPQAIAFALIWIGVGLYISDVLSRSRKIDKGTTSLELNES